MPAGIRHITLLIVAALVASVGFGRNAGAAILNLGQQPEADRAATHAQYLPSIMNRFGEPGLAALGPAGGNVNLASASGAIALTVPAGALSGTTSIQLTAIPAASGSLMQFEMAPADLIFAKPITLQVGLAGSTPLASGLVIYLGSLANPIYLPTIVDPASRTLTAVLTLFPPAPGATQASLGKADVGPVALAAAAGNAGVTQVTCTQLQSAADQALQKLKAHPFDTDVIRAAVEAQYQVGAALQACEDSAAFEQWMTDTGKFLRTQHDDARLELFAANPGIEDAVEKATRRVYAWCGALHTFGDQTTCPDEELITLKFNELGNEMVKRLDAAQQPTEMQPVMPRLYNLMALAQSLGLQTAETHLHTLINDIFNKMVDMAEQRCVPQANLEWLASQITPIIETTEETLHRKIVTCSVQLRIDSQDSAGADAPEAVTYAKGAVSATRADTFLEGKLILSGSAFALRCSRVAGDASPADAFSLRAFGNEIKRFNHNGLAFDFAQTLDVPGIFKTLGLITNGDEPLQLEFWRTGIRIDCGEGDVFELPDQKLFVVNYNAIAGGITISPSAKSLNTGQQQLFNAAVKGFVDKSVQWSAAGGSITQDGLFTAGTVSGTFSVQASSVASPTLHAGAQVTITGATPVLPSVIAAGTSYRVDANALFKESNAFGPVSLSVADVSDTPPPDPVGTPQAPMAEANSVSRASAGTVSASLFAQLGLTGSTHPSGLPGISSINVQGEAGMDSNCCAAASTSIVTFTVLNQMKYTAVSDSRVVQPVPGQNRTGATIELWSMAGANLGSRLFFTAPGQNQTINGTLLPGTYRLIARAIHESDPFCIGCLIQGTTSYNVSVSFSP